jgi:activating signal cointegrator complex subunit 3
MKALAVEITEEFKTALGTLNVAVHEYTGDTRINAVELDKSHMLVGTPEKWDVATRRGGEDTPCTRLRLLIIDEIYRLHDSRGPVIEALVARTLGQVGQSQ